MEYYLIVSVSKFTDYFKSDLLETSVGKSRPKTSLRLPITSNRTYWKPELSVPIPFVLEFTDYFKSDLLETMLNSS
jgi:hypothetical protein